jgi:hypothetical protein
MDTFTAFLIDSPKLGVLTFMLAAALLALSCYGVARSLLISRTGQDSEMLSGRIISRLGALHALILALMFAQEMADYRDISRFVSKEASAISDVYHSLQEYGDGNSQSTETISSMVIDFVKTASTADRIALAESQLNHQTSINYQRINRRLRNLQPINDIQEDLRAQMIEDWDNVSEFHRRLRTIALNEAPGFFWIVIISGFIMVVVPCYVYSPNIANLSMIGTYSAFNGLVMYVIFSIANPFSGALAVDSQIFTSLLGMMETVAP